MGCIETRVKEHKAKKIKKKIAKGWNVCCNYSYAVNGRIWILWRAHIQVQITHMTNQFIHCCIEDTSTQFKTHLSIIYAQNDGHQRENLWRDHRQINIPTQETWLLSGDFNNVLSSKDIIGSPVTAAEIQGFKDVIDDLQLTPLRAKGWNYTWTNKQGTGSRVYSKIDWALGNYQWIQQYGHVEADILNPSSIIQQVWNQCYDGAPMQQIWCKLKNMNEQLKEINAYMASYKQSLEQAREKLDIIQSQIKQDPLAHALFNEEKAALDEIEKWSNVEEQVMRQKSKACWIECGDANTKYFQAQWKIRSNQNSITSIYTDTGMKLTEPKLVEQEFISVFQSLMGDCATELPCANTAIIKEGPPLTISQQRTLIQNVTMEEITEAVREMPKDKATGVDGFPMEFFTRNWEIVKDDIFAAVKDFFLPTDC
ncbi:PREDICTED: uncharacterized protein LOC109218942 [Nicotiana attenuata]|uniref:uncharacterized protein LOC109218942 n=1 Tax=Nicotiana attenuata TaxID=49451 RepID=UPI000905322B|nr:PREDICTED: uncharacterized protein LOC109218942 [Nicotiana attenuata]